MFAVAIGSLFRLQELSSGSNATLLLHYEDLSASFHDSLVRLNDFMDFPDLSREAVELVKNETSMSTLASLAEAGNLPGSHQKEMSGMYPHSSDQFAPTVSMSNRRPIMNSHFVVCIPRTRWSQSFPWHHQRISGRCWEAPTRSVESHHGRTSPLHPLEALQCVKR